MWTTPERGIVIDYGWKLMIGIDPAEFCCVLIAFENVVKNHVVGQAHFFQHDADFLAVWCGHIVQVDHEIPQG
jgi:hypothetical protein